MDNLDSLATVLGCHTGQLPSTYLGLPLGAPHKLVAAWDAIEERMRKKLALWKRNYISKGSRLTLIKSTLASLLIYQLSLVRMPISLAKRLEKLQRNFLWEGGALKKKPHLVNWDVISSNKGQRGLGLRSLTSLNKVLLGKWIWRFASEENCISKSLIYSKFGKDDLGWWVNTPRGPFGVGLWKEILKEASWVKDNWKFRVGNGTRVRFWTDFWCGPSTLSHSFPSLFEIVANKSITMAEAWNHLDDEGGWNRNCVRAFNDWVIDLVVNLLHVLQNERVSTALDRVIWKGAVDATFTICNAYNLLVSSSVSRFPVKLIWMAYVPSKVSFFTWEAAWGKVLALDKLQRRG